MRGWLAGAWRAWQGPSMLARAMVTLTASWSLTATLTQCHTDLNRSQCLCFVEHIGASKVLCYSHDRPNSQSVITRAAETAGKLDGSQGYESNYPWIAKKKVSAHKTSKWMRRLPWKPSSLIKRCALWKLLSPRYMVHVSYLIHHEMPPLMPPSSEWLCKTFETPWSKSVARVNSISKHPHSVSLTIWCWEGKSCWKKLDSPS